MSAKLAEVRNPLAEASAWRIALTEHDQESSAEFERWLGVDSENRDAWARVQSSWQAIGDLAQSEGLSAMRREALMRAAGQRQVRHQPWWGALAACLLLIIAVGGTLGYRQWSAAQPMIYATALDERRVVTLDDLSKVTLDANSEVEVRYTNDGRKLVLLRGQARFDVAKDALRPFSVRAFDKLVVATGTAFTVDLAGESVVVTLIEGKVSVLRVVGAYEPNPAVRKVQKATEVVLRPGQQLVAEAGAPTQLVQPANIEKATSWEQGLLMFEDETLASVAARVSRYSEKKVVVDDSVANLRISGVFVAGDVDTFVDAVSRYLPVRARPVQAKQIELTKRA